MKYIYSLVCIFFLTNTCLAQSEIINENILFHINLDAKTIEKGYTVAAFENKIKLSLVPGILDESTEVDALLLNEEIEGPWQMDRLSNIYQFEFKNKAAYDNHKPFYIQLSYEKQDNNHKKVFFFDKNFNGWRPLPTKDFPDENFVRSLIHLPFARIAVFSYPGVLTNGKASWYKYKDGDFAASPDFPKGSKIRVTNKENKKFVDVIINDFGPDRTLHPDRAIDLDKVAFSKIASVGAGIIDVELEPLHIEEETEGKVLGVSTTVSNNDIKIVTKSAVVYNEKTNEIIFNKNATTTMPLASLTKLVFAKVFLDTKPDFNRIVEYKTQDEEYNYEHVDYKWEVARLKVGEGETMTIEDLFYSALVGSANNAVESLVRVSGLPRQTFIKNMNDLVKSWGASSTYFIEPTGLAPDNVSSALDYAIISKKVLSHPLIQKASTIQEYKFTTVNTKIPHTIRNTNSLIKTNRYNITGSKTGYLHEAGYCLMTRILSEGDSLIIVTLGSNDRYISFNETEELINYGIRKASNK